MYCVPFLLLLVTLFLPTTTPLRSDDGTAGNALARRKREQGVPTVDVDDLADSVANRLAEFKKRSCRMGAHRNCPEMKSAMQILGVFFKKPLLDEYASQSKKGCAFSLGNHCLTESLDNAASEYGYLQSGSSPGRRRRRRSGRQVGASLLPHPLSAEGAGGEEARGEVMEEEEEA